MKNKPVSVTDNSPEMLELVEKICSIVDKECVIGFNLEADTGRNNGLMVLTIKSYVYQDDLPRLDLPSVLNNYNFVQVEH